MVAYCQFIMLFFISTNCSLANTEVSEKSYLETDSSIFSQEAPDTAAIIQEIRQKFKQTNDSLDYYRQEEQKAVGEPSEGGSMIKYYRGTDLKKIEVAYYGSMGKLLIDYYTDQGQVYFVYQRDYEYDKPMYVEDSKVKVIQENRYYFCEGKLIRWVDPSQRTVPSGSPSFTAKADELVSSEVFSNSQ